MNDWLLLTVGENRQHGGNDGYDDDPSRYYSWDETVPNHAALEVGDRVVLWDKKVLIGASVIEEITTGTAEKVLRRCPRCGYASIKARATVVPRYRCGDCGNQFESPESRIQEVLTYRARHDASWVDLSGLLNGAQLRAIADSPRSQLSMRRADWLRFVAALANVENSGRLSQLERARLNGRRNLVRLRSRNRLQADVDRVCLFTGRQPEAVLSTASLLAFPLLGEQQFHGEVTLRRDISSLIAQGDITVDADAGRIRLTPYLMDYPSYASLHGAPLSAEMSDDNRAWFRMHRLQHAVT